MTHEEKFKEMAMAAKESIENFQDFTDDRAISWAYDRIKKLEESLNKIISHINLPCDKRDDGVIQQIAEVALEK